MRWQGRRGSSNVEDRRGGVRTTRVGGGLGVLALALVAVYFGADPSILLDAAAPQVGSSGTGGYEESAEDAELRQLVSVVLADTEQGWQQIFAARGERYEEPRLVLFSSAVDSACGFARAAVGPFYCPADRKVYIDLSFYEDLRTRFGAPGDFAQAYVIAHEVGHHVQTLLGISERTQAARERATQRESNALSVRQELQADCLAGVWAHSASNARGLLEPGDIEEALTAASAIGDDRLQRQAGGYVSPDSFTHGSSEQRVRWFRRGVESGELDACDTFGAAEL
jgi:predicted metalloprotease